MKMFLVNVFLTDKTGESMLDSFKTLAENEESAVLTAFEALQQGNIGFESGGIVATELKS